MMPQPVEPVIDLKMLPHNIQRLVRCIGLEQTLALLAARGGTRVYIPLQGKSDALGSVLNRHALKQLADSDLAGQCIELPVSAKYHQQLRNQAIAQLKGKMSVDKLAVRFGLTRRMIIYIHNAAAERENSPQGDLF